MLTYLRLVMSSKGRRTVPAEEQMTKVRRTVERPEGQGLIHLPDRRTISVRYALVVVRILDDEADTDGLAGRLEVRGTIEESQGQGPVDLRGKQFTLKTDDGRCVEVSAKRGGPLSRQWEIVESSPKGLEPC
jgi:hypothetical protein